jgi:protein SCO1
MSEYYDVSKAQLRFFRSLYLFVIFIALHILGCQRTPERQVFTAHGVIKNVAERGKSVRISHEDIPGFMNAMTMEFAVKDPALLANLQVDDEIQFTVEKTTDGIYITTIQPVDTEEDSDQFQDAAEDEATDNAVGETTPEEFTPHQAADFTLTDQDGQSVTLSSLRDKVILLDFIFTRCPGPCPLLSLKFSQLQKQLGDRFGKEVMLLSITIDPRHDTPEVLKGYAQRYSANLAGWKFLTGSTKDIILTATAYGAEYQSNMEGIVDHRLLTAVIDRNGNVVKEYPGTNHTVEDLMAEVNKILS